MTYEFSAQAELLAAAGRIEAGRWGKMKNNPGDTPSLLYRLLPEQRAEIAGRIRRAVEASREHGYNCLAVFVSSGHADHDAVITDTVLYHYLRSEVVDETRRVWFLRKARKEAKQINDPLDRQRNTFGRESARRTVDRLSRTRVGVSAAHVLAHVAGASVAHLATAQKQAYVRAVAGV